MFKNKLYLTKGVNERIPHLTQLFLWNIIENGRQRITHKQEQPEYCKEYLLDTKPVTETVFVIDDGTHTTMLLGEEY